MEGERGEGSREWEQVDLLPCSLVTPHAIGMAMRSGKWALTRGREKGEDEMRYGENVMRERGGEWKG